MRALKALILLSAAAVCAAAETRLEVIAPSNVFAGSKLRAKVIVRMDAAPVSFSHLYVEQMPAGVAMSYAHLAPLHRCAKDGRSFVYNVQPGSAFLVEVEAGAEPGRREAVIAMRLQPSAGGGVATAPGEAVELRIPYRAVSLRGALPPLDITRWESLAVSLGRKWCDGRTYGFGNESEVWYYDGARVYFQLADWTGDKSWEACAFAIAAQYRDNLLSRNGGIQGWRVFPHGLVMAYERSGDDSYRQAALLMARNSTFAARAGDPNDEYIRETAYMVQAWIAAERLGEPRRPELARAVDYLLGHFDRLFVTGSFRLHQTFFDGLAAEALIAWYEHSGDPRVVPAVRSMLDWLWEHGWDSEAGRMVYNPEPPGARCPNSCQSYGRRWLNLILPAYGWYWAVTGDREYIRRGDELWGWALEDEISWSGKEYSQNYRWSFDYLRWR
ncbi:MAG TPA: hypothetical protein VFQ79_09200 [Bryobacteraceae bacterium]|nr:hypothetical protein [Bryobacteraceae bacterium]